VTVLLPKQLSTYSRFERPTFRQNHAQLRPSPKYHGALFKPDPDKLRRNAVQIATFLPWGARHLVVADAVADADAKDGAADE
jgi:hypothetical protein